jgi:hypothetical protein
LSIADSTHQVLGNETFLRMFNTMPLSHRATAGESRGPRAFSESMGDGSAGEGRRITSTRSARKMEPCSCFVPVPSSAGWQDGGLRRISRYLDRKRVEALSSALYRVAEEQQRS